MKISLRWLSEFFPNLPKGHFSSEKAKEFRERLPLSGIEIGSWKKQGEGIEQVLVAQIQSFKKHPNADKLNVCQLITSASGTPLQIVCGAPNVKEGMKVALAPVGSVLPGDFKIKQAKIRDVESSGMLCSERELGLSEESQGILELPATATLGAPLIKTLGLEDEIWDVELTPDRADCLSHFGIAREVGRFLSVKPSFLEYDSINAKDTNDVAMVSVEVQATKACPIYGVQLFDTIQPKESPDWLRRRLESIGIRSHGAIVDITNLILMELGHPMHAFDADKISGSKIIVRFAKAGEKIQTLDGETKTLTAEDLVIADLERPIALAGVMGGLESAVSDKTTRVILETAVFDPAIIRQMSQRHRIHSDSSHRFERGVDAGQRLVSVGRVALLLKQLVGARKRGAYIEKIAPNSEKLLLKQSFNFDLRAFKDVVGMEAIPEDLIKRFQSVGIEAQSKTANVLKVEVPTHRHDLVREIDLIEEAARLLGYENIPVRYPIQQQFSQGSTDRIYHQLRRIRNRLLETGLTEMMPYSFVSKTEVAYLPGIKAMEIKNPISQEWAYMRPTLSFGLLKVVSRHAEMNQLRGTFFDCGSAFESIEVSDSKDPYFSACRESYHSAWAMMGKRKVEHWSADKKSVERKEDFDFFDAKGVAEKLLETLSTQEPRWGGTQFVLLEEFLSRKEWLSTLETQAPWIPVPLLHPGRSAILVWPGKPPGTPVGYVGELHPEMKSKMLNLPTGFELGVALGEIRVLEDLNRVFSGANRIQYLNPRDKIKLSRRLPVVERDLALVVSSEVKASDLEKTLTRAAGQELLELACVDRFDLGNSKLSLAYRFVLQGLNETLNEAQITAIVNKMLQAASEKHQAALR